MSDLEKARHLSHVVKAVDSAPEGANVDALRKYLADNKVSGKELDALLERRCTDAGAVLVAITPKSKTSTRGKPPPKKKASAKKAEA